MKQLLLFAVIGTGILGMTMGFASNTISLTVQKLGVGEEFIGTAVTHANIDFVLNPTLRDNHTPNNKLDDFFVNLITGCSFSTDETIPGPATVICKLTDNRNDVKNADGTVTQHFGAVIAEGRKELPQGYPDAQLCPNGRCVIDIDTVNGLAFDDANDVQNIHDVKIVVKGQEPRT